MNSFARIYTFVNIRYRAKSKTKEVGGRGPISDEGPFIGAGSGNLPLRAEI